MNNFHHEDQRFVILFTKSKTCHSILSWNNWGQSQHTPYLLMLSHSLCLSFANSLLPRSFLQKSSAHLLSQFLGTLTNRSEEWLLVLSYLSSSNSVIASGLILQTFMLEILLKFVDTFQFWWEADKNNSLDEDLCAFTISCHCWAL